MKVFGYGSSSSDEDDLSPPPPKKKDGRKNSRTVKPRKDYWQSAWGVDIIKNHKKHLDPDSAEHKIFRLRFRVPYVIFLFLVSWVTTWYCFDEITNPTGRLAIKKYYGVYTIAYIYIFARTCTTSKLPTHPGKPIYAYEFII